MLNNTSESSYIPNHVEIPSQSQTQTGTKLTLLLVLGEDIFKSSKNRTANLGKLDQNLNNNYEILSLKYSPSLCQIESLDPDIVILNLNDNRAQEDLEHLFGLCNEIKDKYGTNIPLACITNKSSRKLIKETDFDSIWDFEANHDYIYDGIKDLLIQSEKQKSLWNTLNQLENFKNTITKELEEASIFQGALLNQAVARTNLRTAHHCFFSKEVGGDFFRVFEISPSHAGILIGDVHAKGISAALLTGFILGSLYTISSTKQSLLSAPSELLGYLSESIYSHNNMSELSATAWYGVLNLTSGKLIYARAGHPVPLRCKVGDEQAAIFLEGGSGFPLGMFPGMTYRNYEYQLEDYSRVLLYTDGLTNQKDIHSNPISATWLEEVFHKICQAKKPLRDIPALLDSEFTNLSMGATSTDDRIILCLEYNAPESCHIKSTPDSEAIESVIDSILAKCPPALDPEIKSDFEIAIGELIMKANNQIQKAKLISSVQNDKSQNDKLQNEQNSKCKAEGFKISWWMHKDRLDISICLDEGSIPWSYIPSFKALTALGESNRVDVDNVASLTFFFENIQINASGYEISMSKIFG
ncbi:MAG: PP2C family protein-serine/threonine phosphatase [Candidatus Melainabacteria bacterium]|jgi:serine phosphatase RsbU (regulator of sigma subunit)